MDKEVPIVTKSLNNESNYSEDNGLEYYILILYLFYI